MVAALGGAFYGALQQSITPLDFLWSTSLTLLLLVVLGGRSVISGAVIAGAVFGVEKMIHNPQVNQYLPLAIALGVIGLAQEPEGTVALARRETLRVLSVLRPLPRRSSDRRGGVPAVTGPDVAVAAGGPVGSSRGL
jgi:hypothetical protein